jgi:threonine dehydratase
MAVPLEAERREAAAAVAAAGLLRTPLIAAPGLSRELGCEVRLKLECHQLTGSFKARGAVAAVAQVPATETVVTASAGNHGIGIAFACRQLGRRAQILVPSGTNPAKVDALERFGESVEVEVIDGSYDDTEVAARAAAEAPGTRFVSSYNDPMVVAGQSTVGSEIIEQWPEAEAIVVPVGGGGLLSGVALACAAADRGVAAWGVEPEWSPTMTTSLTAGETVRVVEEHTSQAEGLVGNLDPDTITFGLVRDHATGVILASEDEILAGTARVYAEAATVVEVSAGASLRGLTAAAVGGAKRLVAVLSGANIAAANHFEIIAERAPQTASAPLGAGVPE